METTNTRTRRSKEDRIAEIDLKIEKHKKDIASLQAKKEKILNPLPRKKRMTASAIFSMAKENGLTEKDIIERLGLKI